MLGRSERTSPGHRCLSPLVGYLLLLCLEHGDYNGYAHERSEYCDSPFECHSSSPPVARNLGTREWLSGQVGLPPGFHQLETILQPTKQDHRGVQPF